MTIIVIGLRDAPMLMTCLGSLAENITGVTYEVIVVLNDPTPRLAAEIENGVSGATVLPFRANLGFGGAINFAAGRSRGRYLALVNDDCVVTRGWLESLVETEQRRPLCAIVGSTNLNPDGTLQEAGSVVWSDGSTSCIGEGMAPDQMRFERRVDYVSGGSMLINKEVWDELGGFDDAYYPAYYEDVDLCLRAIEAGWEVWYQPLAAVCHVRSASTGAHFRTFLFLRARETFVKRWSSLLEERETPGARERAMWKAMGAPARVLVIDAQLPDPDLVPATKAMYDTLAALEQKPDVHVAFSPSAQTQPLPIDFALRRVRVVPDLAEHLATDGVTYDVVVISRAHDREHTNDLLARHLPDARIVFDDESLEGLTRPEAQPRRATISEK